MSKKTASSRSCIFCKSKVDDPRKFGQLFKLKSFNVHHFCALFASGLAQNGPEDDEFGFLVKDVLKEAERARRLRCVYCHTSGATIGCCVKRCHKTYHFHCGLDRGSLNQYFGQFLSYCKAHKPRQENLKVGLDKSSILLCGVCYNSINLKEDDSFLRTPCCASGWFHRTCIQDYATSAGYFFKCPFCNNKDNFRASMLLYGIYIPDRDASWELVENAFQELLERPPCGAIDCLCPYGRKVSRKNTIWEIVACETCGGDGRHLKCETLRRSKTWKCPVCIEAEQAMEKKEKDQPDHKGSGLSKTQDSLAMIPRTNARVLSSSGANSKSSSNTNSRRRKDKCHSNGLNMEEVLKISYDSFEDEYVDVTSVDLPQPSVSKSTENDSDAAFEWLGKRDDKVAENTDDGKVIEITDDEKVAENTDDEKITENTDDEKITGNTDDEKSTENTDDEKSTENTDDEKITENNGDGWLIVHYSHSSDTVAGFEPSSEPSGQFCPMPEYSKHQDKAMTLSDEDRSSKENINITGDHELFQTETDYETSTTSRLHPTIINLGESMVNEEDSGISCFNTTLADISVEVLNKGDDPMVASPPKVSHNPRKFYSKDSFHQVSIIQYLEESAGHEPGKNAFKRSAARSEPYQPSKYKRCKMNNYLRTQYSSHSSKPK